MKEAYLQQAMELHKSFPVVDAHLDLAGEILLRNKLGEREDIKEHYLEKWEKAGINLIASSVYVESAELAHGYENALAQIHALKEEVKESRGRLCLVTTKKELQRVLETRQIGILLYMEGLDVIGTELSKLEELHDLGVCGAALTWSRENALATGCCKASEHRQIHGGLTEAGKEAVRKLSEDVGIPANLKDIVKEEDLDFLAKSAYADACRPGNPRETSVEEIKQLYKSML